MLHLIICWFIVVNEIIAINLFRLKLISRLNYITYDLNTEKKYLMVDN
jgi:hypothetical protein